MSRRDDALKAMAKAVESPNEMQAAQAALSRRDPRLAPIMKAVAEWEAKNGPCPVCRHRSSQHVAGFCYDIRCAYCGWSPREEGWVKLS